MDERTEKLTKMLDELVTASEILTKYSSFDCKNEMGVRCSSSKDVYIPYGILALAEVAGQNPKFEKMMCVNDVFINKRYSFEYKGVYFWGLVEVGNLGDLA